MDTVRMMAMSFSYDHEITIEQGRELLIYCVEKYLSAINFNEEIRPYLKNYPFEPKNIEINIFVHQPNHHNVSVGAISVVGAIKGILDYNVRQVGPPVIKQVYKETYQEALEMLAQKGSRARAI